MTVAKDSVSKIESFLKRCLSLKGYIISFYVFDDDSAKSLLDTIKQYYQSIDEDSEISDIILGSVLEMQFSNQSKIMVFSKQSMQHSVHANLVFMDSRFKEVYIKESIYPRIDKFDLEEGFLLNPKLIYIKFTEENENEKD